MAVDLRVLHVPGGHSYVEHTADGRLDGFRAVPTPVVPGSPWAPSPALDPAWVEAHADAFDVLHVHFGFEACPPQQLRDLVGRLHGLGRALVVTVHDLQNPHLTDQTAYTDLLGILVEGADGLITLTPGAASAVEGRWGRRPQVVPHPHVVPVGLLDRPRRDHPGFVVGVHLKSLRANLVATTTLQHLAVVVAELPGAVLRVDVHPEALEESFPRYDPVLTDWLRATPGIDLRVHDRFSDEELWEYLAGLDVSVLPYGHGTHSGWLEACHDLGTHVISGPVGFLAEQGPVVVADLDDVDSLRSAVRQTFSAGPAARATRADRSEQRLAVATAHLAVYRAAVTAARGRRCVEEPV